MPSGPSLSPRWILNFALAESPDRKGVLLFGGYWGLWEEDTVRELRPGRYGLSWNYLDIKLKDGRKGHVVLPLQ